MAVVNGSSQPINGKAWHVSGSGGGSISTPDGGIGVSLRFYTTTPVYEITVRSDHDDYWFWQPTNGQPTMVKKNLTADCIGAILVVADDEIVVVTSDNGSASASLSQAAAAST
jgi:hypothetical protein